MCLQKSIIFLKPVHEVSPICITLPRHAAMARLACLQGHVHLGLHSYCFWSLIYCIIVDKLMKALKAHSVQNFFTSFIPILSESPQYTGACNVFCFFPCPVLVGYWPLYI